MNTKYKLHHFGIATKSIERCAAIYSKLGFEKSETVVEPSQKVKICFLTNEVGTTLELVEPIGDDSPVTRFVKQSGTTPYHSCYEVDDIYEAIDELEDLNFRVMFEPVESEAMDKGLICYLFSVEIGLFELYQKAV